MWTWRDYKNFMIERKPAQETRFLLTPDGQASSSVSPMGDNLLQTIWKFNSFLMKKIKAREFRAGNHAIKSPLAASGCEGACGNVQAVPYRLDDQDMMLFITSITGLVKRAIRTA